MKPNYYVGIKNPNDLKENFFSITSEIASLLLKQEDIKKIREEKVLNIIKLKKTIDEINVLMNHLNKILPKEGVRVIDKIKEDNTEKELKKLEKQVKEIEKEIEKLNISL